MSNNTNTCSSCNATHFIPSGRGSLQEISEILVLNKHGIKEIPDCYKHDLRDRLYADTDDNMGICTWMIKKKNWTKASVISLLETYEQAALDANRNTDGEDVSMCLISCSDMANRTEFKTDEYEDAYHMYQDELESIATKAARTPEARLHWYKARLEGMYVELALHDKIQDALDAIPTTGRWDARSRVYADRIDTLYREKKLSYDGWYVFKNQIRAKAGSKPMKEPKYSLNLLPDRISYYESKMEQAKKDMWDNKPLVTGMQLETEDMGELIEEIEAHDTKVLTQGVKEA